MLIRAATPQDREAIQGLHRRAFPEAESAPIAKLAMELIDSDSTPETLSWVVEIEHSVVAHIAFSPLSNAADGAFLGYILAPLAVEPARQRQGIGSALVKQGIAHLSASGAPLVLVYGDPEYYGRFGFRADLAVHYTAPYPLQYDFGWQALGLNGFEPGAPAVTIRCVAPLSDPQLW